MAASSATQAIQLIQQEWDSSLVMQITSIESEAVSDDPIIISNIPDLDPLVPDAANI